MSEDVYQNKQMAAMLTSSMAEIMQGAIIHAMFWGESGKERFLCVCDEVYDSAVKNIETLVKSLDDHDAKVAEAMRKESGNESCEP